jgi:hypothetical protein
MSKLLMMRGLLPTAESNFLPGPADSRQIEP